MKTIQQFQSDSQQLDEGLGTVAKVAMKGITKLAKKSFAKGLSKSMRSGPKFQSMAQKGTRGLTGKVRTLYHGTSSDIAKRAQVKGLSDRTTEPGSRGLVKSIDSWEKYAKKTGDKTFKRPYFERGRSFVTNDKFDAETYARKTADLKNKGLLRRIGLRKKVEPVIMKVSVPKKDMRVAKMAGKEYTVATQNVQPKSVEKVGGKLKDETRKRAGYDKLRTDRLSKLDPDDPLSKYSREQIKKSFGGTTDKK